MDEERKAIEMKVAERMINQINHQSRSRKEKN